MYIVTSIVTQRACGGTDTRMSAHAAYCVQTQGCKVVVLQATGTDLLYRCNVLLRLNTLKELLVQKVYCILVHSIVSALCMKYSTDSENLSVYISL